MSKVSDQRYRITIKNWDQYQREMRGGEKRKRRREWVALSVDLFSDPDFLALDLCHRVAWVALLLHAGKVGPVFELRPSDARVMFQLRRSPDFEVFANQGFITLQAATRQDKTGQDKTGHIQGEAARSPRRSSGPSFDFEEFKKRYPKRAGDYRWRQAVNALNARLKEGWRYEDDILPAVDRYRRYCEVTGKVGTETVKQAATFCGSSENFENAWEPPEDRRLEGPLDEMRRERESSGQGSSEIFGDWNND